MPIRDTSADQWAVLQATGRHNERVCQVHSVMLRIGRPAFGCEIAALDKKLHPPAPGVEHSETTRNRITELIESGWAIEHPKAKSPTGTMAYRYEALRVPIKPPAKETVTIHVPLKVEDYNYLKALAATKIKRPTSKDVAILVSGVISQAVLDDKKPALLR